MMNSVDNLARKLYEHAEKSGKSLRFQPMSLFRIEKVAAKSRLNFSYLTKCHLNDWVMSNTDKRYLVHIDSAKLSYTIRLTSIENISQFIGMTHKYNDEDDPYFFDILFYRVGSQTKMKIIIDGVGSTSSIFEVMEIKKV